MVYSEYDYYMGWWKKRNKNSDGTDKNTPSTIKESDKQEEGADLE